MWVWIDHLGVILFDATLSTAVFLSLIALAMLACRQPARRILIARVALMASLAMIPLIALAPLPRFDLLDALIESNLFPRTLLIQSRWVHLPAPEAFPPVPAPSGLDEGPIPGAILRLRQWLPRSLTLLDMACVGIGSAWLVLGLWGVHWLLRHSREPSAPTRALFDQLLAEVSRKVVRPKLRVSPRVQHPVIVGLVRPTILIPPSFDACGGDLEPLRLSLLHEIAHAEQFDAWFSTTASLAQSVWFFLPQMWWLRSQLLIDQEFLADRAAASRYGTSPGYAASLLALAKPRLGPPADARADGRGPAWPFAGRTGDQSPLFQRVLMLLYCPFPVEARAPRSWSWSLKMAVIGVSLLAACLCIRWPDTDKLVQRLWGGTPRGPHTFHVADFVAEPYVAAPGGRSSPSVLPFTLPSHFDLSVEVRASRDDLPSIRIAGLSLGTPRPGPEVVDRSAPWSDRSESWFLVRLRRDDHGLFLSVGGEVVAVLRLLEPVPEWLTIEPCPEHPVTFRNLVVTW